MTPAKRKKQTCPPLPAGCSPARWAAYTVLSSVLAGEELDAPEAIRHWSVVLGLSDADRRLCSAIVLNVLRNLLTLDYQIRQFTRAKASSISPSVRNLLLMIAAQRHFFDRVPVYAAVYDAVEIAKALRLPAVAVRFINAVGRRLASQEKLIYPPASNLAYHLSIRWSLPRWFVQILLGTYGESATAQLVATINDEPRAAVRVNTLRTTPQQLAEQWAASGIHVHASEYVHEALVLDSARDLAEALAHGTFREGFFYVQDEASQVVSHALDPRPGELILDLCAAPGGKATHLAELSRGLATIHATDRDSNRLAKLEENLVRLQTSAVEVKPFEDIERLAQRKAQCYDAVLVDAPCSALGTVRRHPEVRWRVSPPILPGLAATQRSLLSLAARLVRPGGRLVYATCSPLPQENHEVIETFLKSSKGFILDPPRQLSILAPSQENAIFSSWPHHPHLDGFCIAVLRRQAD